jgi:integrase
LKENEARQGYIEEKQYDTLMRGTDELWLKTMLTIGYTFGWRKGELQMKVEQVDLANRELRLYPGSTKNKEGRTIKMTNTVYELVRACVQGKGPSDFVFTRKCGTPVVSFKENWWELCVRVGLGRWECFDCQCDLKKGKCPKCGLRKKRYVGLLFHDLRRSAVRNMVRRNVPERVAMKISGHKTRSIFDRYNIVSSDDLADAALKIERGSVVTKTATEVSEGSALVN